MSVFSLPFPPRPSRRANDQEQVGIIDIGSNSVRLMVYHAASRVPLPVFNEKYLCHLGQGLEQTGALNPQGVALAHQALARFMLMAKRLRLTKLHAIATAAVRDASDGEAFAKDILDRHGLDISVIAGEEEARLAALGVMAAFHTPQGICADLGGGSMEIASIGECTITHAASAPMGVLRLKDRFGNDHTAANAYLQEKLAPFHWMGHDAYITNGTLYAVGGSFRAIAKSYMDAAEYPFSVLHEYVIASADLRAWNVHLREAFANGTVVEAGIPQKRAHIIDMATLALDALMDVSGADTVTFSVSGIREGYLYDGLDTPTQNTDPLIASARGLAAMFGRYGHYAKEVLAWSAPLFEEEDPSLARIREAACMLSEIAWTIDPNFRSQWAYNRIIHSSMKGLNHVERVALAKTIYHRYSTSGRMQRTEMRLLSPELTRWSRRLGLTLNLAFQLSGGQTGNLHQTRLIKNTDYVSIDYDKNAAALASSGITKRLLGLSDTFKL